MTGARPARILILNQAFYPDVVSTAQHAADLGSALAAAGYDVTAIASERGYDDPQLRFPPAELWRGARILRVGGTSLGKSSRWRRAADFASFLLRCAARALSLPRFDLVIAMTTPSLISVLGAVLVPVKARALLFWCMDLNPDEAIAAGWLRAGSLTARVLSWLQSYSMRRARRVVALDRFMAERVVAHGIPPQHVEVIAPWPYDDSIRFDPAARTRLEPSTASPANLS